MPAPISSPLARELLDRELRLAFFDIDGTLLGLDGDYSARLRNAIAQLRGAGIKTAVASGRPKFAADFLIRDLNLTDAGLFYTGALIYDPLQGKTIALHPLAEDLVSRLLEAAREQALYTEVCGLEDFFVEQRLPIGELHSKHLRARPKLVASFDHIVGRDPVIKLLFAVNNKADWHKLYRLQERFGEAVFAYAKMAAKPDWLFVSVITSLACKRKGFSALLDYHQVDAEQVIAFGDAQSDEVFLELAGVGVAMGNASDAVKLVADIETIPVWDDGVAVVIEHYLDLRGA